MGGSSPSTQAAWSLMLVKLSEASSNVIAMERQRTHGKKCLHGSILRKQSWKTTLQEKEETLPISMNKWKEKNPHFVEQVSALYPKDQHMIVGCRSGIRSKRATADLLSAGFNNVRNLEGGYLSLLRSANQSQHHHHPAA